MKISFLKLLSIFSLKVDKHHMHRFSIVNGISGFFLSDFPYALLAKGRNGLPSRSI